MRTGTIRRTLRALFTLLTLGVCLAPARPAHAWATDGHMVLTEAAVLATPASLPSFFRSGAKAIARDSRDPDFAKNRSLPALRNGEGPEHFLDLELLKGRSLPATRYGFIHQCARAKLDPDRAGLLPYALAEATERLALAFAESRQRPEDTHVQAKCRYLAGQVAHYAQDLCQPLHTTVHHDGKVRPDGSSPRTGIHSRIDDLITALRVEPSVLAARQQVTPVESLMPAILSELKRSNALVTRVYMLEPKLRVKGARGLAPEVSDFAQERARASVRFTASLYATAWKLSGTLQLPKAAAE
ncbi:MAG TPA: hypothetical protein GX715_18275 [Armatimonadetes bacterium]|nr:hypothetical protein [Armatimonadota bacterium]